MLDKYITNFLKENSQPTNNSTLGPGYRASVTLKDGAFLPCVIFRTSSTCIDTVVERLKQEQAQNPNAFKSTYGEIVKAFITSGNRVNDSDIASVGKCRFALPLEIQNQIKGETSMSWNAFIASFKDGRKVSFGTTWSIL